MAEINTDNSDWSILSDLAAALRSATRSGVAVFERVNACGGGGRELIARPVGRGPLAVVEYRGESQRPTLEDMRCRQVQLRVHLALRPAPAAQAQQRLQAAMELLAAVRNAVEGDPPRDSMPWGDRFGWQRRLAWSNTTITDGGDGPWLRAGVDLEVNQILDGPTGH